jgi:uncharacterized protein YbjT (DUF2867 family)
VYPQLRNNAIEAPAGFPAGVEVVDGDLADSGTLPAEQAVEASGLEWAHLRPGAFAANRLALWGPSIRAERVVRWPYPDEVGPPIHEADIAAVAPRPAGGRACRPGLRHDRPGRPARSFARWALDHAGDFR